MQVAVSGTRRLAVGETADKAVCATGPARVMATFKLPNATGCGTMRRLESLLPRALESVRYTSSRQRVSYAG